MDRKVEKWIAVGKRWSKKLQGYWMHVTIYVIQQRSVEDLDALLLNIPCES